MPTLSIRNIAVDFPFEPYPCQLDYMDKVIEALSTGSNALLESPTGTGKTLCLLCASLAWQKSEKLKAPSGRIQIGYNLPPSMKMAGPNASSGGSNNATKLIIYASRTHNQLTQVISELRVTGYNPRMTVMASREQLCVHERISKLRGGALNHACSKVSAQRSCMYKNNLEHYSGGVEAAGLTGGAPIMDIEQLVDLGREDRICPYFFSRDVATKSELILLPYNYLIDGSIRSTLRGVEWQDCCVILDEAHNLEQVASDAAAFSLSSADIAACILEMKQVIRLTQLLGSSGQPSQSSASSLGSKMLGALGGNSGVNEKPDIQSCARILEALFALEAKLDQVVLTEKSGPVSAPRGSRCAVLPGSWMVNTLEEVNLPVATAALTIIELKKCSDFLMDDTTALLGQGTSLGGSGSRVAVSEPKLSLLAQSLAKVYRSRDLRECVRIAEDFSVFVQEELSSPQGQPGSGRGRGRGGGRGRMGAQDQNRSSKKRVLNYWCFSPGVVMEELKKLGVRSFLLTSGTLSPMEAFREDLKIPFSVFLENPHVISDKQIWVAALATGPKNRQLKSTYEVRETIEYKDELGDSILAICQSMRAISSPGPAASHHTNLDGGILVFFPTYGVMESAAVRWKQTGLWESLCSTGGHVIMESRGGGSSRPAHDNSISSAASKKWRDDDGGDTGSGSADNSHMGVVQEFEAALETRGRCILLAVCRGKVSEGIDFRDSKGRVAIITGIPFAPHMDPRVVLKRMHLDDSWRTKGSVIQSQSAVQAQAQAHVQRILDGMTGVSTCSPQQPAVPAAHVPAASSGPNNQARRLTGQAWYDQSASRAVNQALGRVIRHQKDWGTVFLLDSRFQTDKQQHQLSSWVRARLLKIPTFFAAIQKFREFCGVAMNDPDLRIKIKEPVIRTRNERTVPMHLYQAEGERIPGGFQREVIVSASALGGEGMTESGESYINPSMLMSQQTYLSKVREDSGSFHISSTAAGSSQGGRRVIGNTVVSETPTAASAENDLMSMLSQMRGSAKPTTDTTLKRKDSQKGKSIADMFDRLSSSSRASCGEIEKSSANSSCESFSAKSPFLVSENSLRLTSLPNKSAHATQAHAHKATTSSFGSKPASAKRPKGLSSSDDFSSNDSNKMINPSQGNASLSSFSQSSQDTKNFGQFGKLISQSRNQQSQSSGCFSSQRGAESSDMGKKEKSNMFKTLVGDLETELSPECFAQFKTKFKGVVVAIKTESSIDISKIRCFADSLVSILYGELSSQRFNEVVDMMAHLFSDSNTMRVYRATVKKTVQYMCASGQRFEAHVSSPPSTQGDVGIQRKRAWESSTTAGCEQSTNSSASNGPAMRHPAPRAASIIQRQPHSSDVSAVSEGRRPPPPGYSPSRSSNSRSAMSLLTQQQPPLLQNEEDGPSEGRASKRAKHMQFLSSGDVRRRSEAERRFVEGSPSRNKPGTTVLPRSVSGGGILAKLEKFELAGGRPDGKALIEDTSKLNRLTCIICNDQPPHVPCVAKCGHVCCKRCWEEWLKVKPVCPGCRLATTATDIARVVIGKG